MDLCSSLTLVYSLNVTSRGVDPKSSFFLVFPGFGPEIFKKLCSSGLSTWNQGTMDLKIYLAEQFAEYSRNLFFILSSFQFCYPYFLTASQKVVHSSSCSCYHTLSFLTMTDPLWPFWPFFSVFINARMKNWQSRFYVSYSLLVKVT